LDAEMLSQLCGVFGLSADSTESDVLAAAQSQVGELNALKAVVNTASEEKRFQIEFPTMYQQQMELAAESRANKALVFANDVSKFKKPEGDGDATKLVPTKMGMSALAMNTVMEAHQRFAVGQGTLEDFENAIRTISDGGVLEFGEVGSAVAPELTDIAPLTPEGIAQNRKAFAERVAEIKTQDGVDFATAISMASERYPELAKVYGAAAPA
jgi:hypothetical protein